MKLDLKNKVILVTGGAGGIGESIVRTLAIEGAIPVILDWKQKEECEDLIRELDVEHIDGAYLRADLTDEDQVVEAVRTCLLRFETIDGVVNSAGADDPVGLQSTPEQFRQALEQNLTQCFTVVRHTVHYLRQSAPSAIVNIGSKIAFTGQGGHSGFAAAKGGLVALTREWAVDLAKDRIRVNAVVPSEVWKSKNDGWRNGSVDSPEELKKVESRIPLEGRLTEPQEIADMVVFLLSPRSSHTTGQIIHVDGGSVHLDRGDPDREL